ncbi:MAG: hypothetical protein NTY77_14215 [Elusimicrobia bacterium]|nr:hypothetical protein [Elusimicrobiota bacterium]
MEEEAPRRSSKGIAVLAVLAVAGSAVGVMIYQLTQKEKPAADIAGFDISKTQESRPAPSSAQALPGSAAQTDRTMFQTEDLGKMRFGVGGGNTAKAIAQKAADSFTAACRKAEGMVQALAISYTKRYPSISKLGRDWMGYPDLKKLNDDYMRDHDPVAFLHGTAQSKNFAKLLVKYAADPAVQSFVKEGIVKAPGDVTSSAMSLVKEDNSVKTVVSNAVSALGLPPVLTAPILEGGKVDEKQVMGQIMQGNPGLQGAMQDPNVQKALQQQQQGAAPSGRR